MSATFAEILSRPRQDPWLYRYCGDMATKEGAERYLRHLNDMLTFARVHPAGKGVLDVGCGFGFTMIALHQMGARVSGIDVNETMVATINDYGLPIRAEAGDAAALPYGRASIDLLLSIEAISHYRDVSGFIREAARVVKPGGVVLVADSNNALSPWQRRWTKAVWKRFETTGEKDLKPYVERRREWIAEHFPDLPPETAEASYGYDFEELARMLPGPVPRRTAAPVNPEDGMYLEHMFNPFQLARDFQRRGFKTKVRGYWGGASGRPLLRFANRVLSATALTLPAARGFRLAARR
jgi:ubiquinone/menaquinone biosynthesis C-methylase UbiE